LAFGESAQLDAAKIGVLSGSIMTGTIGALYLATRAKLVASRERGVPAD